MTEKQSGAETVEIIRDTWGIPHVYAETEDAGFYGLGYATAEDRMFQMMLRRRETRGRLAEILGAGPNDKFVESDRQLRIMDLGSHATREISILGNDERKALEAYARGVNAYLDERRGTLSPLFDRYGGHPEPWTIEDSLMLKNRHAAIRSTSWKGEVLAKRAEEEYQEKRNRGETPEREEPLLDDEIAIVTEEEFRHSNPEVYDELLRIAKKKETTETTDGHVPPEGPKFSHNWVVAGGRSTTGMPILGSDPQLTVQNPNTGYEFHLNAGRYNVRGFGFAGEPTILVGFSDHCAWGATALNSHTADLFEERVNPDNPNQYRWKDEWKDFEVRTETITVKDADPIVFEVRSSHHGPVVNDLVEGVEAGEIFALQTTLTNAKTSSVDSVLKMMRATDWETFRKGMSGYLGPAIHCVYADIHGDIGYQSLVNIPARPCMQSLPREGWTGQAEWEMLPFEYMPSMRNPKADYISTANDAPVGSWHPFACGNGFGGGPRSARLREIFAGDRTFSVQDFVEVVHQDTVSSPVRDFIALVAAVIEEDAVENDEISAAVVDLQENGARMLTDAPHYKLGASVLTRIAKAARGDFIMGYGGNWSVLMKMFRTETANLKETGKGPQDPKLRQWLLDTLNEACELAKQDDPDMGSAGFIHHMPYQDNYDFGSLAPEYDQESPPLRAPQVPTIWSQLGECYCQVVDMGDLDRSLAMMPPGISENPDSPHFNDQNDVWEQGTFRAAPITRRAVEAIQESVVKLEYWAP